MGLKGRALQGHNSGDKNESTPAWPGSQTSYVDVEFVLSRVVKNHWVQRLVFRLGEDVHRVAAQTTRGAKVGLVGWLGGGGCRASLQY